MERPPAGVDLLPYYRVLPPAAEPAAQDRTGSVPIIRIAPGTGFGDGSHETTQLCLLALGFLLRRGLKPETALDFGAGSGVLAIAAALAGARVEAVETDAHALEGARRNARLNRVEPLIALRAHLREPARPFDLVLANILGPVLLEHAEALCARQSPGGHMVLSGLVATDVPAALARFEPLLAPMRPEVYARGAWRAILFSPALGAPLQPASPLRVC